MAVKRSGNSGEKKITEEDARALLSFTGFELVNQGITYPSLDGKFMIRKEGNEYRKRKTFE